MKISITCVVAAVQIISCASHVVLTFPPARPLPFDFLDDLQSTPPCGVDYNEDHRLMTTVVSGQPITVTWHVAYPHQGGIKIQLLETSGAVKAELTDGAFLFQNDSTKLSHTVTIDGDITCEHCVLRISRQAKEWSTEKDDYVFWSCADVTVVDESKADETTNCYEGMCLNGGMCEEGGVCSCLDRFEGDRCQYENECAVDTDCNAHGQCIRLDTTTYPKKVCFCEAGWMGRLCGQFSRLSEPKLLASEEKEYQKLELFKNPEFSLFWKFVNEEHDEVEIALRVETDTWCAIGWRPSDLDGSCKEFPASILPKPGSDTPQTTKDVDSENDETGEEESSLQQDNGSSERRRRKRETVTSQNDGKNMIELFCKDGNKTAAAKWAQESFTDKPVEGKLDEVTSGPELREKSEEETTAEPVSELESQSEADGDEPKSKDQLHPMDCMDIILVTASGRMHRVLDGYTRDRSTPQPDSWYGGTEDLTAAVARREKGVLHIRFTRKIVSKDMSDHSLLDEELRLIWARGQTPTTFHHKPFSGLEMCEASDYGYYRINELKYHGTEASQRGTLLFNVFDGWLSGSPDFLRNFQKRPPERCKRKASRPMIDHLSRDANNATKVQPVVLQNNPDDAADGDNEGLFRHPDDCVKDECEYKLHWRYRKSTDQVHFKIEAKVDEDQWAAVGFSEDKKMEKSDAVVGWVDSSSGELTLTDRWLETKTSEGVALDNGPISLLNPRGSYRDGKLKIMFSRARDTKDKNDLSLSRCLYFLYAWGGGLKDGDLSKHKSTTTSDDKVCVGSQPSSLKSSSATTYLLGTVCFVVILCLK